MTTNKNIQSHERGLRFFNEIVYEALPAVYNAVDWLTFGVWWRLVRRSLNFVPLGGCVLEVGFGPGRLQVELAKRADMCLGLDLAWGMCHFTQERLLRANLPSRLVRGDALRLPFADNTFDSVISTFAVSGIPNGNCVLQEMARVTATNGRIVLVDIGLPSNGNRLGTSLARLWERMGDFLYDLPQMITAVGLTLTAFEEFGPGNHIRAVVGQKTTVQIRH